MSKAGSKFGGNDKGVIRNCTDMCCNKESGTGFINANEKYKKDLEVTLKDYN